MPKEYTMEKRILVSWISYGNDFINEEPKSLRRKINHSGPTFTFYKEYIDKLGYNEHYIFCLEKNKSEGEYLVFEIGRHFKKEDHIFLKVIPDIDAIDSSKLYPLVNAELLKLKLSPPTRQRNQEKRKSTTQIDALFSTGTPAMQITWAFCKFSNSLNKLYQTRREVFISDNSEGLVELSFPNTNIAYIALFKEKNNNEAFIIDKVSSLKKVYEKAEVVAKFDFTILIQGESGTGKENLAQTIHETSFRKDKKFKAINCAAFGDSLLESRLFGYVKGAFSDASKDTLGYFDVADGGTIFLDEIGDITPYMQQTLLRVLQESEFSAVGSTDSKKVNVRIIAATNKDLIALCQKGLFRWDLYYRLAVVELELPTFRSFKKSEKLVFIHGFIKYVGDGLAKTFGVKEIKLSKEAENFFLTYEFPGNIRELKHIVEGFYAHQAEIIELKHFPSRLLKKTFITETNDEMIWDLEHHEKILIQKALVHFKTQAEAAKAIGYKNLSYFGKKIEQLGLKRPLKKR